MRVEEASTCEVRVSDTCFCRACHLSVNQRVSLMIGQVLMQSCNPVVSWYSPAIWLTSFGGFYKLIFWKFFPLAILLLLAKACRKEWSVLVSSCAHCYENTLWSVLLIVHLQLVLSSSFIDCNVIHDERWNYILFSWWQMKLQGWQQFISANWRPLWWGPLDENYMTAKSHI